MRYLKFNPRGTLGPLETEFERIRQKHEDSDFGMSLLDEMERENEADPFTDDDL